jgi:hypothetical protein
LARRRRIAILGIVPLGRPLQGRRLYQPSAALGFASGARHIYAVGRDRTERERRLLACVKNAFSAERAGFAFAIETSAARQPRLLWETGSFVLSAEDALFPQEDVAQRAERIDAEAWLLDILAKGPMQAAMLRNLAAYAKISWRSVQYAKARLGIESLRKDQHWEWELPAVEPLSASGAEGVGDMSTAH